MNETARRKWPTLLGREHRHFAALIEGLGDEEADALMACARIEQRSRGDVVVEEGHRIEEIAFVLDGALGMTKRLPDGRVHIVGLLVPGDMFGRLFDGPVAYRIEALSTSRVLSFDRARFEAILSTSLEAEQAFLVMMLDEIDAAREWLLLLNGTGVVQRLAGFLLVLVRRRLIDGRHPLKEGLRMKLPLRRTDLSHYLGVRPESLSRAVHRLQDDGILTIVTPNTFVIDDIPALVAASGQDFVLPDGQDLGRTDHDRHQ